VCVCERERVCMCACVWKVVQRGMRDCMFDHVYMCKCVRDCVMSRIRSNGRLPRESVCKRVAQHFMYN
jgi:hypothetical protein